MYSNNNDFFIIMIMFCNGLQERSNVIIIINMQVSHSIYLCVPNDNLSMLSLSLQAYDMFQASAFTVIQVFQIDNSS